MKQSHPRPGLDAVFSALSNPTRRAILGRLAQGEALVGELAEPFDLTQPAISHHLRVLETAGLISRRIEGTSRPCRLSPKGLETVEPWLEMLRHALSTNYSRLDTLLSQPDTTTEDTAP